MEQTPVPVIAHRLSSRNKPLRLTPQTARFPFNGTERELGTRKHQFTCNITGIDGWIVVIVKPVEDGKHERKSGGLIRRRPQPCRQHRRA